MSDFPTITLKWEKPVPIIDAIDDPSYITSGIYCIIRKYGKTMNLYYIGKSAGVGVKSRLKSHLESTVNGKKGEKLVSFARVSKSDVGCLDLKQVIDDIESALIYKCQPEYNIQKKASFKPKYKFVIKNSGHKHDSIPDLIDIGDLVFEKVKSKKSVRKDDDWWF